MLHNKFFEILKQYSEDYSKEIYGRELTKKVSLSQKNIALTLEELEKKGILNSRKVANIKYYKLNLTNKTIKDVLFIVEVLNKIRFLENHLKIANIFKKDDPSRIVGIFGSYARGTEKKDSDLDVFIVGDEASEDYDKIRKIFNINVSTKYFSEKELKTLLKEKNNLIKEIVKDHVMILNTEKFINLIWRYHYGHD